jgi:hypothetical protein
MNGYGQLMVLLIRVAQVAMLLGLAFVVVSLVIAALRPETGVPEKRALVVMMASCLAAGAGVTSLAARLNARAAIR